MAETSPTTRLEAVNFILSCLGKTAILSLDDASKNPDAELALARLDEAVRQTNSVGYWYNTDKNRVLDPDVNGQIILPANTLRVDSVRRDKRKDFVKRGNKLYDRVEHTYTIGKPVEVDLVSGLAFEDMPETARWYCTTKAARRFVRGRQSAEVTVRLTADDEQEALIALQQEDTEADDRTMAQASPHVARMRRGQR